MKGYVRGKQYEVGQTYHGIDVYTKLSDLVRAFERGKRDFFCDRYTCRFFEIEASEIITYKIFTFTMADVTITRELSNLEVNRAAYGYCGSKNYGGNGTGDGCGDGHEGHCSCFDIILYGTGEGGGEGSGYLDNQCRRSIFEAEGFGDGYIGTGEGSGRGDASDRFEADYVSNIEDIGIFIGG